MWGKNVSGKGIMSEKKLVIRSKTAKINLSGNKTMSGWKKYAYLLMAVIAGLFLYVFLADRLLLDDEKVIQAGIGNAEWDESIEEPTAPSDDFIDDDVFTILEIVPHKGMGNFGYLVAGQEGIDTSLLPKDLGETKGILSTLGKAVSLYNSYIEEELEAGASVKDKWIKGNTIVYQNGYFEYVGNNRGNYSLNGGKSYIYVGPGQGDYIAVPKEEDWNYYSLYYAQTNRRNVKAYFVAGQPDGVELYNTGTRYRPHFVNENPGKGDYDYDYETGNFVLNKGKGDYDVIFERGYSQDAIYYMLKDGFELVFDNTGTYSWSLEYKHVGKNKGDFLEIDLAFQKGDSGDYIWVQDDSVTDNYKIIYNSKEYNRKDRIYIRGQAINVDYQYTYSITMINNEWFKKYILKLPSEYFKDCNVEVITMTPEELNLPGNINIIRKADLFYISEDLQNWDYIRWYRNYNPKGKYDANYEEYDSNKHVFKKHDLSWECTEEIFKCIAGVYGKRAGAIISSKVYLQSRNKQIDYNIYTDMKKIGVNNVTTDTDSTICNVAKLYLMLMQRDLTGFYNAFMNPDTQSPYKICSVKVDKSINPSGTTGSFVRPDRVQPGLPKEQFDPEYEKAKLEDIAIYWNLITFMPYEYKADTKSLGIINGELADKFPNMDIKKYTSDLHENVMAINGSEYVNHVILPKILYSIYDQRRTKDYDAALIYINSFSDSFKDSLNVADIICYIINGVFPYPGIDQPEDDDEGKEGSNNRDYISVLNIQPTADFESSNSKIKEMLSGFNPKIKIDEMTSSQFNSNFKDINAHYDIIYVGAGVQRFNLDASKRTIFNDNDMSKNHYIFFGEGDSISTTEGSYRYYGNDLSHEAAQAIKEFANAGYIVILEPLLYNLSPTVNKTSNMYKLIGELKSDSYYSANVLNLSDYENKGNNSSYYAFLIKIQKALKIARPRIDLLDPSIDKSTGLNYFYPANGRLTIQFKLEPNGAVPGPYRYNAYLYLDINGDGIFDEDEQINIIDNTGTRPWEGITESRLRNYYYHLDMRQEELNLNGVYQWKVKVIRSDNEKIRSEVTGFAAYSEPETIRVLQIVDNPRAGVPDYKLSEKANDPDSMMYELSKLRGLEAGSFYSISFDTLSVDEYEALFDEKKPYTTHTRTSSNRLARYHVLILDNQLDEISDSYGALQNIKDEIEANIGVIFTKNALDYNKQANYLKSDKQLFDNRYSYNKLNRIANSGQLYIYSNLNINGDLANDNTYMTNYLTKANRGRVSEFPYNIGKKPSISKGAYSDYMAVAYNRPSKNDAYLPLTGWYCLSDAKSPVTNSLISNDLAYKGIYSSSPNDVNNNYYLISRGNIFYSGIVLENADNTIYKDELKLFINTIFAAYQNRRMSLSSAALITFIKPQPVFEEGLGKWVAVSEEYVSGNDFVLIFSISQSSSAMDLQILLDGEKPSGDFGNYIYKVTNDTLGEAIAINNSNKAVNNGTYAIKIPLSELTDEKGAGIDRLLTLIAINKHGDITTEELIIRNAKPPVVTILDPQPIWSGNKAYIYTDIDYYDTDISESYLDGADMIRIVFKVDQVQSFTPDISSEGENLLDDNGYRAKIYSLASDKISEADLSAPLPAGEYVLYLPAGIMKAYSSRELVIKAIGNGGTKGESSVILLRRNLFSLD